MATAFEVFYKDGGKKSVSVALPLELMVQMAVGALIDNTRPAEVVHVRTPSDMVRVCISTTKDGFEIRRSDNNGAFRTILQGVA